MLGNSEKKNYNAFVLFVLAQHQLHRWVIIFRKNRTSFIQAEDI